MLKLYFATYKGLVNVDVAQILEFWRHPNHLQILPHIVPGPVRLLVLPSDLVNQMLVMLGHNFVVIFHCHLIMLRVPPKNLLQ